MWLVTVISAVATAVVDGRFLKPWVLGFRPADPGEVPRPPVSFEDYRRDARNRAFVAGVVSSVFGTIGLANFVAVNRMSWGLAFNLVAVAALVAGIGCGLWRAWTRFENADWRLFRRVCATALVIMWMMLAVAIGLTPPERSDDPSGLLWGATLATILAFVWIPFVGLPASIIVGLCTCEARRMYRRRCHRDRVTASASP